MGNTAKLSIISIALLGLCACDTIGTGSIYGSHYSESYGYADYNNYYDYTNYGYFNSSNDDNRGYQSVPSTNRGVRVPNSYHVGEYRSPQSHKSRDKQWVKRQNPGAYTIELSNSAKASKVAKDLHKTPKNNRMAQIKYKKNGKTYYKGVYGSYNSKQDALKAMNNLPSDLKAKAGVKKWGSVQNQADTTTSRNYNLPNY